MMPALAIANARLNFTRSRRNLGFVTDLWKPHSARARAHSVSTLVSMDSPSYEKLTDVFGGD